MWKGTIFRCRGGHKEVAEYLLANNADVNAENEEGWTPLHMAAENNHDLIAELLLANKANVNARSNDGSTPLLLAAFKGGTDLGELLLDHGANVNDKDNKYGYTALRWATDQHHEDMADMLRQHGGQ